MEHPRRWFSNNLWNQCIIGIIWIRRDEEHAVDDSRKNSRYDMIIGRDLLLELKLDLRLYYCMIRGNGGAHDGCTVSMKDPYDLRDDASFRNYYFWESEHVLDSTRLMRKILDTQYQKAYLRKTVSNSKHLNNY